tara:strand:- start:2584 stop:2883 length:300 start_codon:yes stop_codon:yes gene_type:complete
MPELHRATLETPESVVLEMSEHMAMLADKGDWEEIERLAIRLRSVFTNVPESRRRGLVDTLQQRLTAVTREVKKARKDVSLELGQLRRGQKATKAYELR